VDLARDFMSSVVYVGQSVLAPWTLPGEAFSVHGLHGLEAAEEAEDADDRSKLDFRPPNRRRQNAGH
jgi:hypothetical protein